MTGLATTARWTAVAIAAAAVLDPALPLPTRARPAVRVIGEPAPLAASVIRQLRDAGFTVDGSQNESAIVLVGALSTEHSALSTVPLWALDTSPAPPNVRIVDAVGPTARLPEQAIDVRVTVEARGLAGKTTEVVLEDAGIVVSSATHAWSTASERWHAVVRYLPPGTAGGRLRVRAVDMTGETSNADNAADIAVPPMRGPIRTLVVEAGVTWPAMFVRRSVEGEPAFAVAAFQRAAARIATRAGAPPSTLTKEALAPFEAVLVGAPERLTRADGEALRWFVEQRGGVAVLIPDHSSRAPSTYLELLDTAVLEPRTLEAPAPLGVPAGGAGNLKASELLVARRTPPASTTLAATAAGETVVFSTRRGAGAVILSGALDAWRYRGQDEDAFARFWRRAIAEEATAAPPILEVSVQPSLLAPGERARITARLRATELPPLDVDAVSARAVSPGARVDVPIRLWPASEPGVYEGEWRPSAIGDYDIAVTAGPRRADTAATVAAAVPRGSTADSERLEQRARASGGRVFPADQSAALVDGMKSAFPARRSPRATRPMRSPWWVVPFAGLLCVEWAFRRRRGLR